MATDDDQFQVRVQRNYAGGEATAQELVVRQSWSMKQFRKAAARKLGISKAKKVFLSSGSELSGVDEMQNDDLLYISSGEPFFRLSAGTAGGAGGLGEVDGGGGAGGAGAGGGGGPVKTLHVSVLGTGGVGKSALTLRFVRGFFVHDWDPTIEDAYRKQVDLDDRNWLLEILDTAGQDDFESLRPQWMMEKDGYIFVYSMDKQVSLDELVPFYELHGQINETRQVPIVLVANKKDMCVNSAAAAAAAGGGEGGAGATRTSDASAGAGGAGAGLVRREVSEAAGRARAAEWGAEYVETSAYTGENVDEVFHTFIRLCGRKPEPPRKKPWYEKCVLL